MRFWFKSNTGVIDKLECLSANYANSPLFVNKWQFWWPTSITIDNNNAVW